MIKKVIFEKLTIENFLSVGNDPVVIEFNKGLHIITGINKDLADRRNGIGKSTIVDALSFVLFGETLRELKKEFVVNNITKKTSRVSLVFKIENNTYELQRTIEPNKCFLLKDNNDITRDSMVNTTEFVQKLLNLNPEVFQNCVAMTVNNTTPFMAKKKVEKRKFIEGIFNLEKFSEMNSLLKSEASEVRKDFDIKNGKLEELKKHLSNLIEQSNNTKTERENRQNILLARKEKVNKEIADTIALLDKIKISDISEVQEKITLATNKREDNLSKINETGKEITSLETKRDFVKTTLSKIGTDKDKCPVCLKSITQHDKDHIAKSKQELKEQIKELDNKISVLENTLKDHKSSRVKIDELVTKLKDMVSKQKLKEQQQQHLRQKIQELTQSLETIDSDIKELESRSDNIITTTDELQSKVSLIEKNVDEHKRQLSIFDSAKFVLSEDGVRSFIVKKILTVFNNKLSAYLKKLNSNASIKFDEYFEETITNSKGVSLSYFNFSGAEKKVIDLAIMFTFVDMLRVQGGLHYNIQFYDELLDTSLDEVGVEMVVGLLNDFVTANKQGIYIISHRKECAKLSTGDVIYLQKQNGITKRIPYSG